MRRRLSVLLVAALALGGLTAATGTSGSAVLTVARAPGLHVVRNRLVDRNGRAVQFHGVNRSGTEYACVQGWGVFDGPSDAASVKAIAS